MNRKVIVSLHAVYTTEHKPLSGTGAGIERFLKGNTIPYQVIKFPLVGRHPTISQFFSLRKTINNQQKLTYGFPLSFITFQEFFYLLKVIKEVKSKQTIFIGINPLNAFYGILLKKMGKVKSVIFYTADYAINRYENKILNFIYHRFDKFAIHYSDYVWNVSSRITNLRKEQGVPEKKNFHVPNSPNVKNIKKLSYEKINRSELILVSSSPTSTNIPLIFKAISELSRKYPHLLLKIIGLENWKEKFAQDIKKLRIEKNVEIYSNLAYKDLINLMRKAAIGLAIYTNQSSWTYFSDSMKARDYLACGLPVIITDIIGPADEIEKEKAGFVIKEEKQMLIQVLDRLLGDEKFYKKMRKNAIILAKKNDFEKHMKKLLLPLL